MTTLQQQILTTAQSLIGITEIPQNQGWHNAEFQADMTSIAHWTHGQSWCAQTQRVVWHKSFLVADPGNIHLLARYFSANCMETWLNFRKSPEFKTSPTVPVIGALAIWRHGTTEMGHMGCVSLISGPVNFASIEGNTSNNGSREGNIIWENHHLIGKPYNANSLNLVGFVYPNIFIH